MPEGSNFTPLKDGELLHHAEIMTLRQIGSTLQAISSELQASRADMVTMKVDVAIIKERQQQHEETRNKIKALEDAVDLLQDRNARQDGAYTLITALKEFGPWVISLAVLAWGLFDRVPHR